MKTMIGPRLLLLLPLFVFFCFFNCHRSKPASKIEEKERPQTQRDTISTVENPDARVILAMLRHYLLPSSDPERLTRVSRTTDSPKKVVFHIRTTPVGQIPPRDELAKGSTPTERESFLRLSRKLIERNRVRNELPELPPETPFALIAQDDLSRYQVSNYRIDEKGVLIREGDEKQFPYLNYEWLHASLPAFSEDGTQAVGRLNFGWGGMTHDGDAFYLLKMERSEWVVQREWRIYYV
jgi:hypothetical protein